MCNSFFNLLYSKSVIRAFAAHFIALKATIIQNAASKASFAPSPI